MLACKGLSGAKRHWQTSCQWHKAKTRGGQRMALRDGLPQQDSRALVLAAVDVVELISQTVALKRRGRKFVGLCPFHQEKTPSFTVDPVKQAFYCFGCKASGSVFDFVMMRDRVEFKDALEILAR